jgi:putative SOS response-associated peptidase YedK
MCGRFTQYNSREEYLAFLGEEAERDIPYDPEPVGRYNVAPGTRVLLLSERRSQLHLDHWGYAPEWWNKPALINARSETAASSRMFRPLWEHGRAIVFADGWFEWKQQNGVKQPFFIYRKDGNPLLLAAIGKPPFENGNDQEGFLIVTAAADEDCWIFTIGDRSCTHRMPHVNGSVKTQPVKRRKTLPVRAVFPPKISHGTPSAGLLAIPGTRAGNL